MSYMSVDGERSATQHAGIPAIQNAAVEMTSPGVQVVVAVDQPAQKIKVLSYNLTPSGDSATNYSLGTSGSTSAAFTGIMGGLAGIPTTMPMNFPFGYFTTNAGESLVVSSAGIQGNVVFQRTY